MVRRALVFAGIVAVATIARAQTSPRPGGLAAAPETWGTAAGYTTVMAHDFLGRTALAQGVHDEAMQQYLGATYCAVGWGSGGTEAALAQVDLPDGATLSQLQFWAYDVDPVDGVNLTLWETCQTPGLDAPVSNQLASVDSFGAIGTYFGFTPLNGHRVDARNCAYTARATFTADGTSCKGDAIQLQKIQVSWVRDVAPAPPSATFGDVPTSHPFFGYVEALVASGVTGGCGSGNYCPDAALTRAQMAVFLAKALGLEWP